MGPVPWAGDEGAGPARLHSSSFRSPTSRGLWPYNRKRPAGEAGRFWGHYREEGQIQIALELTGSSGIIGVVERPHVKLSGDIEGTYVVEETRSDGRLVISPDTSAQAIMERLGHEPATLEEFEAEYGAVQPPDGEG